jgi:hypothetical protein
VTRRKTNALFVLLFALLLGGLGWWASQQRPAIPLRPIGLFTSLPIIWAESEQLGDLLQGDAPTHWAKVEIERRGRIVPLDTLDQLDRGLTRLVIAQPRPLSPSENVALDAWVRAGGQLLLIVDPALTAHSAFPVGDPRRPQDIALLSPILSRWGLELTFDDGQAEGEVLVQAGAVAIPVNLPGRWRLPHGSPCRSEATGLLADCRIGRGKVLALADAEVLSASDEGSHQRALAELLDRAFARR